MGAAADEVTRWPASRGGVAWAHPTRDDPVVARLSAVVGGPVGDHAGRHRWWHPLRVLLALTTVTLCVGLLHQVPCERASWSGTPGQDAAQDAALCSSVVADAWVEEGLAELVWPLTGAEQERRRLGDSDLPPLVAAWAWGAARVTHVIVGSPDVGARGQQPLDDLAESDDVRREVRVFVAVNAVGLALLALVATGLLTAAASRFGRPWDAAAWAVSPLLALTWLTGWTVIPAALLAAALAAWLARRRLLAGVALALALTALVPWQGFGSPDLGSVWLVIDQAVGLDWPGSHVLVVSALVLAAWSAVVAVALVRAGRRRAPGVRVAQAAVLVGVGVLVVSPSAPPSWSLLLVPAAALAVPRWRDLLVWQVGELVALLLTGLYLGDYLAPTGGGPAVAYWVAVAVRLAAQAWLVSAVAADLWTPPDRQVKRTSSTSVAV